MTAVSSRTTSRSDEIRTEVLRKSIHLMIGMTPLMANVNIYATMALLASGIVVYSWAESVRLRGKSLGFVTAITQLASRDRDRNKAVLGPVTLGLGALLCLMLYPEPAATVGIYALAFGDGLSSLVGKLFGRIDIPFTGGKTLEGSLTAFLAIWFAAYSAYPNPSVALTVALAGTALEALPLDDLDNLVIPLGTALVFSLLYPH